MVERTLADEIISIVHSEANNNPLPVKCTIHETYSNGLIDVLLENGTILTYLPVIGSPHVGDTGVLLYLDDEKNNQIIITNGGSGGGSTDVSWGNILNKPSTFPPSNHTHLSSDVTDLIDVIYPVGSIYMSVNSTSPQTLFGFGVWEKIEDKFLLASGSTYANGSTGGSADAVIVSHSHKPNADGENFVTSEDPNANNTKVAYSASGNRWVDGQTSQSHFHHRTSTNKVGEDGTGKNMPPYIVVNVWKRTA